MIEASFWARIEKTSTCWIWLGHRRNGYGAVWDNTSDHYLRAHRVAYELLVGEIPSGLGLDHLCRNRACVNPAHLEPVTNRENLRRSTLVLSTQNAMKASCKWGHEFSEDNVVRDRNGHRQCLICTRRRKRECERRRRQLGRVG